MQNKDGSIDSGAGHDLERATEVPDFLDSLLAFQPDLRRGRPGAPRRLPDVHAERQPRPTRRGRRGAQVYWPEWLAELERTPTTTRCSSASASRTSPRATTPTRPCSSPRRSPCARPPSVSPGGGIFADREAARFRRVSTAPPSTSSALDLPPEAPRWSHDQGGTERVRLVGHDPRPHPQPRRPAVRPVHDQAAHAVLDVRPGGAALRPHRLPRGRRPRGGRRASRTPGYVQYAILFDRMFRFPITGERVRNYDGLGGQLLFAYLHQHDVLRWTDNSLTSTGAAPAVVKPAVRRDREALPRRHRPPEARTGSPPTSWSPPTSPRTRRRCGPRVRTPCPSTARPRRRPTTCFRTSFRSACSTRRCAKKLKNVIASTKGHHRAEAPREPRERMPTPRTRGQRQAEVAGTATSQRGDRGGRGRRRGRATAAHAAAARATVVGARRPSGLARRWTPRATPPAAPSPATRSTCST